MDTEGQGATEAVVAQRRQARLGNPQKVRARLMAAQCTSRVDTAALIEGTGGLHPAYACSAV